MARSLILRRAELSKYGNTLSQRAAQYVRMSTIHQRYSIENQAAAIAAYALRYNFTIVRTYRDDGISGLRIEKREGLKQLITDVCSGSADFSRILVYDVSRWGRFQDVDESAHYEFLCRKAGIRVEYVPSNSTMMAACFRASSKTSSGSWPLSSAVNFRSRFMTVTAGSRRLAFVRAGRCLMDCAANSSTRTEFRKDLYGAVRKSI